MNENVITSHLTIRFTEEELKAVEVAALKKGQTMTSYVKNIILENVGIYGSSSNDLTLTMIDQKASLLKPEELFSIKGLFELDDWIEFSKKSRLSMGRLFFKNTEEGGLFHGKYEFVEKGSSNLAIYRRK